jgi:catechol 2,3-dioxygenase-like lactoylglutathione lyase family enzyme
MADLIRRTSLMVRDAEAAARWYGRVLGMTRAMDTPFILSGEQLAAGAKGDRLRLVILRGEHDQLGMIGLMEWLEPRQEAPAPPTRIQFGQPVFVVAATDCRATVERARAAGSRIHCEPRDWTVTGFDGTEQRMVGASFFDLDGYFFEVNERVA